jgi:hypothetical protein
LCCRLKVATLPLSEPAFWANGEKVHVQHGTGQCLESGGKKVETLLGPKYPVATVWLPNGPGGQPREFICFRPLTTIISGINLAHEGKRAGLQMVPAGEKSTESFWVRASGL